MNQHSKQSEVRGAEELVLGLVVYVCVGGWGGGVRWWCLCTRVDVDGSDDKSLSMGIPVPGIPRVLGITAATLATASSAGNRIGRTLIN